MKKSEENNGCPATGREEISPAGAEAVVSDATTNMHVSTKNAVLLQTAQAEAKATGCEHSKNFRFVFDAGSQKSYVTEEAKHMLRLTVIGCGRIFI